MDTTSSTLSIVMGGLDPASHALAVDTWMTGSSPVMTVQSLPEDRN
jgi:hypothetical protein